MLLTLHYQVQSDFVKLNMSNNKDWRSDLFHIEEDLLNSTYLRFFELFNRNQKVFMEFVDEFGGQQINLSDHIYSCDKVREQLIAKASKGDLNIAAESLRVGYGKRWIRNLEKSVK